jgi:hypothetical protein
MGQQRVVLALSKHTHPVCGRLRRPTLNPPSGVHEGIDPNLVTSQVIKLPKPAQTTTLDPRGGSFTPKSRHEVQRELRSGIGESACWPPAGEMAKWNTCLILHAIRL